MTMLFCNNLPTASLSPISHSVVFQLFIFLLPVTNSVYFNVTHFDTTSEDIHYEGDAEPNKEGAIEMNRVDFISRVGRATYVKSVQIWDSDTGTLSDFTTHFTFVIDTQGAPSYGNGLAFFLAPVGFPIPLNSAGGLLGLFNRTTFHMWSQNQIIFIEFDSFPNPEFDPPGQHVGININYIGSAVWDGWNASLHSGDTANVWITYNATSMNLSVYWTYEFNASLQGNNSRLSYVIDLRQVLQEWVTVGFSAATGWNVERHILKSWEFNSTLNSEEIGRRNKGGTRLIVSVVVSATVLIIGISFALVILCMRYRTRGARYTDGDGITRDFDRGAGPKRFTYRELVSATNNFSDDKKLGEGGYGVVYRGHLTEPDLVVAIKKISRGSKQGKKEYVTEVKTISQLRHRNLVQLIGWCHDQSEFLLVYEYMSNGSLDFHIFGGRTPLPWAVRYKIALGLASGLLYLHEEWEQCVVHRDIKSANIMLDSNFNVKLGDFGLARLMDHELGRKTTGLAGTLGYLAPEYIRTGKASKESDVFSFGVVALEIACGRKTVDPMQEESEMGFVEWVWALYGRGKLLTAVDKRLFTDFDPIQVECLMTVGLWCAHPDHNLRPSIRQAIQALMFETKLPDLPPNMPVPSYHVHPPAISWSDPSTTTTSVDGGH